MSVFLGWESDLLDGRLMLALVLLDALWQITLIGLVYRLALTRWRSPRWRYGGGCLALLLIPLVAIAASPWRARYDGALLAAWSPLAPERSPRAAESTDDISLPDFGESEATIDSRAVIVSNEDPPPARQVEPVESGSPRSSSAQRNVAADGPAITSTAGDQAGPLDRSGGFGFHPSARGRRWLVFAWMAGVTLCLGRLLIGVAAESKWRRRSDGRVPRPLHAALRSLTRSMGVPRPLRLASCREIDSPLVSGWLRPMILLPATAIPRLSHGEWRAVLAHELAHVRRHDILWNWIQSAIETFFFFHPVAWWISASVRREREFCCDDAARQACDGRRDLVAALLKLEEARSMTSRLTMAAGTGRLVRRVERLATGRPEIDRRDSHRSWRRCALSLAGWAAGLSVTILIGSSVSATPISTLAAPVRLSDPLPFHSPPNQFDDAAASDPWHENTVEDPPSAPGGDAANVDDDQDRDAADRGEQDPDEPVVEDIHTAFIVEGQVTDADGDPVPGVTIVAYCGIGTLRRTGETTTDEEGCYRLSFGPGMLMEMSEHAPLSVGVQVATISARRSGLVEQNMNRAGDLLIADHELDEDNAWGAELERVVRPLRPYRLDFVMLPAVTLHGRLVNERGRAVRDQALFLVGDDLPPSQNVLATASTDRRGEFTFEGVPTGKAWCLGLRVGGTSQQLLTDEFTFDSSGEHQMAFLLEGRSEDDGSVRIRLRIGPAE